MSAKTLPARDIVVIASSTGGIEVLRTMLRGLPAGLPATLFIVQHIGALPSHLPEVLSAVTPLPVTHARDSQPFARGQVYVAPPDHHMILERDHIYLRRGPKEHFTRPAADPLFRSAAASYGPRVIGIVLSGGDHDGTEGLHAVTTSGGIGIVQDPTEAKVPQMPENAIEGDGPDYCVPAAAIAPLLIRLIEPAGAALRRHSPTVLVTPSAKPRTRARVVSHMKRSKSTREVGFHRALIVSAFGAAVLWATAGSALADYYYDAPPTVEKQTTTTEPSPS